MKLGFPEELLCNGGRNDWFYACATSDPEILAAAWWFINGQVPEKLHVGLYRVKGRRRGALINQKAFQDSEFMEPTKMYVDADPLSIQLAINHLIQTHLPAEVTNEEA